MFAIFSCTMRAQIFVAPDGSDSNPGTFALPLKTLTKAMSLAGPDSLIYLRGGIYSSSLKITISKSGTAGHTIKVWAYPDETPIFDFSSQLRGNTSSYDGLSISGSYLHFKGIEVEWAGHNGIYITGSHNIIERCIIHDNMNTGLHMRHGASYNLILNCDSYFNFDTPDGGDADGFSAKWEVGVGNVFRGCRAYNNSDDGWDLWMAVSPVEIDSCWAFRNGVDIWFTGSVNGNGNGFKLGGSSVATYNLVKHCVAFDNAGNTGNGFDENNNLAGQTLYNCTSFRNKSYNYRFANTVTQGSHIFKNCISYVGTNNITSGTQDHNSWQDFTVTDADFVSMDTSQALAPRKAEGSLPDITLFHLASGSSMIDAGIDVGLPFRGGAPDLGAFESGGSITYSLTINTINGTVVKNPNQTLYASGSTVELTAVPATGYHFIGWSGDAISSLNPTSVSMTKDLHITASFGIDMFEIVAIAGVNGTISPIDTVRVPYNSSRRFTFIPELGYCVDSVLIDGSITPDSVTGYTFVNVKNNHSIRVVFKACSYTFALSEGWNMISIPGNLGDPRTSIVFPTAASQVFSYAGSYVSTETLKGGVGYWMKVDSQENVQWSGFLKMNDTIDVVQGWNMIGGSSITIPVTSIQSIPEGIIQSPFYEYKNDYLVSDTLQSTKGYWVKVDNPGKLILSTAPVVRPKTSRIQVTYNAELPPPPPGRDQANKVQEVPKDFDLFQNYPNPFNSSTQIKFSVDKTDHATLEVFNLLGQRVLILFDDVAETGRYYEINFNMDNLTSGIYFYKLRCENKIDIKKLTLMK